VKRIDSTDAPAISTSSGVRPRHLLTPALTVALLIAVTMLQGVSPAYGAGGWYQHRQRIDLKKSVVTSVSCTSESFCVAVDASGNAVVYNGLQWSSPTPIDSALESPHLGIASPTVSCISPGFCVAVDGLGNAMIFNGTAWSSPLKVSPTELEGVSCVSSTFCMAVGAAVSTQAGDFVIYNGTGWAESSVMGSSTTGALSAVSCLSSTFCIAVSSPGSGYEYNGSSWSALAFAASPFSEIPFAGVSCVSMTFCVAVTVFVLPHGAPFGTIWTFDGTSWSSVSQAFPGLTGVSCASVSFCEASADFGSTLEYDGTSWSNTPKVDHIQDLNSVSCPSITFCAAVGNDGTGAFYDGLSITTSSLPSASVGLKYSTPLSAGGGHPPYTWKLVHSRLPAGLRLNHSTGVIFGTASQAGTTTFTVEVLDQKTTASRSNRATNTKTLTLTVS
jgi:hypothetical protein